MEQSVTLEQVYKKSREMKKVVEDIPNLSEADKRDLYNIIGGNALIMGICAQTEFSCNENKLTPYANLNPVQKVDLRPIMNKQILHN